MTPIDQTTPATLADSLGLTLYPWQRCALDKVQFKASISTPSKAGKDSRIIAPLALWWVSVYSKGKVVILSDQFNSQTFTSIAVHSKKFPRFGMLTSNPSQIETSLGGRIITIFTDQAGRAEGWNSSPDSPLLIVVNEAQSVPEEFFQAFDRCTPDALLYIGTAIPGKLTGHFAKSFSHGSKFKTMHVLRDQCPHLPFRSEPPPKFGSTLDGDFAMDEERAQFIKRGPLSASFMKCKQAEYFSH